MQESSYQYPEFGTPESQRQQQQQQFSSFPSSNTVFSVQSQLPQQSSFEPSLPGFHSRAPTGLEALSSQLSISQQQYYNTCDAPSVTAQTYASTTPYQTQPGIYRSTTRDHRASAASETSGYQAEVAEYAQLAMSSTSQQQQQQQQSQRSGDIQGQGGGGSTDEEYEGYQEALRQTYQDVIDGRLVEAGERLLTLSEWLLTHAVSLGTCLRPGPKPARRIVC